MASLNPALRDFWGTKARNKILYGGRASSKSHDAAGIAVFLAQYTKLKFLCVRQFQNRIADSVYTLIKIKIEAFGLQDEFKILDNSITHKRTGSEFLFYGLARNITEIKSIEGVDILWSEESHLLNEEQWKVLEPTIRKEGSECWIIFNPNLVTDFVWKRFVTNPPPNTIVRKINYTENPFLSSTMLDVIVAARDEDYEAYEHTYLGEPLTNDDEAIIKRSWIMAAIDGHKKLGIEITGTHRIGFDVADDGADLCCSVEAFGILTTAINEWKAKEDEILKSCTKVYHYALVNHAEITYDAIGVGASCGGKFNELGYTKHKKFLAGGAVLKPDDAIDKFNATRPMHERIINKNYYTNLKAQMWWIVSQRFQNTYNAVIHGQVFEESDLIFIDGSIVGLEQLITELSTPRKSFDNAGRVMVESKQDLKKRGISSPNKADAFVMANLPVMHKPIKISPEALNKAKR